MVPQAVRLVLIDPDWLFVVRLCVVASLDWSVSATADLACPRDSTNDGPCPAVSYASRWLGPASAIFSVICYIINTT